MTFDEAAAFIGTAEGEWNRNPMDPGGTTRWGISQSAHPGVDLESLTWSGALEIYRKEYWDVLGCDALPDPYRLPLFDAAIQHGPRAAVKLLQQTVGATPDGIVGYETRSACARMPWSEALSDYLARRAKLYAVQPGFATFGFGWLRRLFNLHRAVYDSQGGAT